MQNKTTTPKLKELKQKWHFIDAQGQVLGRLAATVSRILTGKDKAIFTPNVNVGDKVVITNADKFVVTGKKMEDKKYIWYTGFPGGLRSRSLQEKLTKTPTKVLEAAISGMMPKNKLRAIRMRNLYIYTGAEHPHKAQQEISKKK